MTETPKPPIVLLHSSLSSKTQWQSLIRLLAPDYQAIALDLYGYGTAPFPEATTDFCLQDEIIRLEKELATQLPVSTAPFHLVGHSYGAAVALKWAYLQPQRVLSLTLFEPVAFHLLSNDDPALAEMNRLRQQMDRAMQADHPHQAAAYFVNYWNGTDAYWKLPETTQKKLGNAVPMVTLNFSALINDPCSLEQYAAITAPCCLIAGTQSRAPAKRVIECLSQTLPHQTLHWVDAGHMAPLYHPEEVNPIIVQSLMHRSN